MCSNLLRGSRFYIFLWQKEACSCRYARVMCVCEVRVLGFLFAVISARVVKSPQNVLCFSAVSTCMFNLCVVVTTHIATERQMTVIHCFLQTMFFQDS